MPSPRVPRRSAWGVSLAALLLLCAGPAAGLVTDAVSARPGKQPALPKSGEPSSVWTFDETTTGNDILWTSPTAVDPSAPTYHVRFVIERVEVTVSFLSLPFGPFDVTDQIPPEQLLNTGYVAGPAPLALLDAAVVAPPPPEPLAVGATLSVGLATSGFASLSATNVTLGTVAVPLGFPFGTVNATITGIRIRGSVTVTPKPWLVSGL